MIKPTPATGEAISAVAAADAPETTDLPEVATMGHREDRPGRCGR